MTIAEAEREANKLGISYGLYVAYRDTGYLEDYKRLVEETTPPTNVVPSNVIGGKGQARRYRRRQDQKL